MMTWTGLRERDCSVRRAREKKLLIGDNYARTRTCTKREKYGWRRMQSVRRFSVQRGATSGRSSTGGTEDRAEQ